MLGLLSQMTSELQMATCCLKESFHAAAELGESQHQDKELIHLVLDCWWSPPMAWSPKCFQASPEVAQECS